MKVTLQRIATQAGVTAATVSMALRNNPRISAARRSEIRRVAEELGYRPNALVSTLMSHIRQAKPPPRHTGLLYLVSGSAATPGAPGTTPELYFRSAREQAARHGFHLELFWLREPGLTEARIDRILRARNIPGVIVAPREDPRPLPRLAWERLSAVMISSSFAEPRLDRICADFPAAIRLAMAFLKQEARTRPVRLILPESHDRNVQHLWNAAYLHERSGRKRFQPPLIVDNPDPALAWVERHPGGIVLGTNLVLSWLRDAGLQEHEHFRFVSLNVEGDSTLTGIREPSWEVGTEAADRTIARIHLNQTGLPTEPRLILIEPRWQQGSWGAKTG